ncbi:hypothetical protein DEI93_16330 (plasmid) [Curtobacterium sp. MCBD17_035]|uniref:hypothetical protein n=1 Tax=Curtobacterium sp. MCBD17_035 TaxID=2175673 RepID=UPI0011B78373|nr:hypothetical protein [Curtobacterium sp. MCBD17_035]WIB69139.1 hypothetical protein DEI93_16330 [Curtobacterium sp. MCBD17_035]
MSNETPKPLRLFREVPNRVYDRLIVRYPFQTDRDYAASFHFAAQRLAETFSGQPIDDLILLPFLTLYRQAFELQLKNTIRGLANTRMTYVEGRTSELLKAVSEERFKKHLGHNLYRLLNDAKRHYAALDMPETFPESVEKLVVMLHEADESGTAFRYAGDLPDVQDYADFPDLAKLLDEQFTLLSVVEDYVDGLYGAGPTLRELAGDSY